MRDFLKLAMTALLVAASVHLVAYAAKNERIRVLNIEENFTVRYPRSYAYLCLVFFLLVSTQVLEMLTAGVNAVSLVLVVGMAALGVPLLLYAFVWKIRVLEGYILYVGLNGVKRLIRYEDISKAVLEKSRLTLVTTLRNFTFDANVIYREYFLKRLQLNGADVERFE